MSVQLYRINRSDILKKKDFIMDIELDIVLLNNSVFHGIIKEINPDQIIIQNMMRNNYTFLMEDIFEIVYSK